jgi:hypothetical protein
MASSAKDSTEILEKDLWCDWTQYGGEVTGEVTPSSLSLVLPSDWQRAKSATAVSRRYWGRVLLSRCVVWVSIHQYRLHKQLLCGCGVIVLDTGRVEV